MAHYVSNSDLHASLVTWLKERKDALADGLPIPRLPESIGEAAYRIATKLGQKANFAQYTYRDDLVADSLLCVCTYIHNYKPDKSTNAFAYVTQIIHNAFIRRIQTEQKHTYIKAKLCRELDGSMTGTHSRQATDTGVYRNTMVEYDAVNAVDIISSYEAKVDTRRIKNKETLLAKPPKLTGRLKTCERCNQELDHFYFSTCTRSHDGRRSACKPCQRLKPTLVPKTKPEPDAGVEPVFELVKYCSRCNALLPLDCFHHQASKTSGRNSRCKACWAAQYQASVKRLPVFDPEGNKQCSKCLLFLSAEFFTGSGFKTRKSNCRGCQQLRKSKALSMPDAKEVPQMRQAQAVNQLS